MNEITFDFACRDDCLDKIVPSDLRQLVAERDRLRARLAEIEGQEPVAWPLASPEDADKGWTLDYRFIEQVERIASQHTDYTTSMEATEQVLIAANAVLRASQPAEQQQQQHWQDYTFTEAMKVCEEGLREWREKPHNKRWWKRIGGTPIPNDLLCCIAEALAAHRRQQPDVSALEEAPINVVYVDGVGAGRRSPSDCRYGVSYVTVADTVYWPLSADDAQRLRAAECGRGDFTGPANECSDVAGLVEALECMIIGACAVAVPHNGERAVLQDAVSIARKALAAHRKQEPSHDNQ